MSLATEVAEFLGSIICIYITRVMSLKSALRAMCMLITISSITMVLVQEIVVQKFNVNEDLLTVVEALLILTMNLGVVCSFDIAYLINPELFPTLFLATAYGACNILGRFVSIFSPIIARVPTPFPLIALGGFAIVCFNQANKL